LCTGAILACDDRGSGGLARSDTSVDAGPVADARPTEPDTEPADAAGSSDMAAIEPLVATAPAQVEVDEDGEVRFTLDGSGLPAQVEIQPDPRDLPLEQRAAGARHVATSFAELTVVLDVFADITRAVRPCLSMASAKASEFITVANMPM
jgi:hypothetical protein